MGLKDKLKNSKGQEKKIEATPEIVEKSEDKKVVETGEVSYAKKIDKVYAQLSTGDVFFEVLEDGFNLTKDDKGYNTKVHFNFAQLDAKMKQKAFTKHYLDFDKFLYLRTLFLNGEANQFAISERSSLNDSKKYCSSLFSEFKPFDYDGKSGSSTLSVTPGNKEGKWMVAVSQALKGEKAVRIQIPVDEGRMVSVLEFIYLAYLKHLLK